MKIKGPFRQPQFPVHYTLIGACPLSGSTSLPNKGIHPVPNDTWKLILYLFHIPKNWNDVSFAAKWIWQIGLTVASNPFYCLKIISKRYYKDVT